jgi:hypothetical protein
MATLGRNCCIRQRLQQARPPRAPAPTWLCGAQRGCAPRPSARLRSWRLARICPTRTDTGHRGPDPGLCLPIAARRRFTKAPPDSARGRRRPTRPGPRRAVTAARSCKWQRFPGRPVAPLPSDRPGPGPRIRVPARDSRAGDPESRAPPPVPPRLLPPLLLLPLCEPPPPVPSWKHPRAAR